MFGKNFESEQCRETDGTRRWSCIHRLADGSLHPIVQSSGRPTSLKGTTLKGMISGKKPCGIKIPSTMKSAIISKSYAGGRAKLDDDFEYDDIAELPLGMIFKRKKK